MRCHCGTVLTPTRDSHRLAGGNVTVYQSYTCWRGRHDNAHGRPYKVRESMVLPWVRAEADRLRVPAGEVESPSDPARQDELLARRQRVVDNYEDGLITRVERTEKIAAIDAEIERLADTATAVLTVPPAIDWTWPTEKLNGVLRAMWSHVDVDEQLRPIAAEWVVAEWRHAG